MAAKTKKQATDPRALRRAQLADLSARNQAAIDAAAARRAEEAEFAKLSLADQKRVLRQRRQDNLAAQAERNKANPTPAPPAPRRIAGTTPEERRPFTPVTETKPREPVEETKSDDGLDDVPMTDAAREKAREHKLTAKSFARKKKSGAHGFTVADVERIAGAK